MYVTEYDVDPANDRQTQGDVVRVAPNGRRTRIGLGRLFYPAGAAVARNGTLYVSNWSVVPGTPPTAGTFTGRTGELVAIAP
jgi:sugar lactone lactonase YvrE